MFCSFVGSGNYRGSLAHGDGNRGIGHCILSGGQRGAECGHGVGPNLPMVAGGSSDFGRYSGRVYGNRNRIVQREGSIIGWLRSNFVGHLGTG